MSSSPRCRRRREHRFAGLTQQRCSFNRDGCGSSSRGNRDRPASNRRSRAASAGVDRGGIGPFRAETVPIATVELVALDNGRRWPSSPEDVTATRVGGCFVCFERGSAGPGRTGDRGWAAAAILRGHRTLETVTVSGVAPAPYMPGLLALREGPLRAMAIEALRSPPDVFLIDATGRDHPRHAGMAFHLGAALGVPTVGVTNRTLVAAGGSPGPERFARAPLLLDGTLVGWWVRTRPGAHPVAAHAAWRTDADTACRMVVAAVRAHRTPEPLRVARHAARVARAGFLVTAE
jgi:deoxyribonuclease V